MDPGALSRDLFGEAESRGGGGNAARGCFQLILASRILSVMTALAATDRQQFSSAVPLVTGSRGVCGGSWLRTRMFHTSITSTAVQSPGGSAPCFLQTGKVAAEALGSSDGRRDNWQGKQAFSHLIDGILRLVGLSFGSTLQPSVREGGGPPFACVRGLVRLKGHES